MLQVSCVSETDGFVAFQRNYRFQCRICAGGEERWELLTNTWTSIVLTAMYNLFLSGAHAQTARVPPTHRTPLLTSHTARTTSVHARACTSGVVAGPETGTGHARGAFDAASRQCTR